MLPQTRLLLLLGLAVVGSCAASTNESCVPSGTLEPTDGGFGPRCPGCCASFLKLPLQEWSKERSEPTAFQLPWGQEYPFAPVDYPAIASQLCNCLEHSDEPSDAPPEAFVHRNLTKFYADGRPLNFFGFNHPHLIRYAASNDSSQNQYFHALLERAAELGMNVARVWAHYEGYDIRAPDAGGDPFPFISLQMEPGLYNETTFQALDQLLALAGELDMRLILSLSDYNGALGTGKAGFEPYLMWLKGSVNITGLTTLDFYTDERIKMLFKANLCAMANRVNTVTGVKYKNDPTIFAWELINEPACVACPGPTLDETLYHWIEEMSNFMKCVDGNHMVSVGLAGTFGMSTPWRLLDNPGPWALCFGEDFSRFVSLPSLDYGVAHMYETNRGSWNDSGREPCGSEDCVVQWYHDWFSGHMNESTHALHKPFVLEEFGLAYSEQRRNEIFSVVRDPFQQARAADPNSAAAGAMFWLPALKGKPNTDGLNVYLDGSEAPYPAENQFGANRSKSTQEWLDSLRVMQEGFRRRSLQDACMAQAKLDLLPIYDNKELKLFSSNSTLEILSGAAQEAAALALGSFDADITSDVSKGPSAAAEAPSPIAEAPNAEDLACPTCSDVEELPLRQWASESKDRNVSAFRLPWGQDVLFEAVDYTGAAEVVCNCLSQKDDTAAPKPGEAKGFVERQGTQLQLGGKPFYFAGFHAGQLPQLVYTNRSAAAEALLSQAAELGFQVGRIEVPCCGADTRLPSERAMVEPYGGVWVSLQTQPGSYSEAVFQALDKVIADAAKSNIRLVVGLADAGSNFGYTGPDTTLQFVQWVMGSYNVTGQATVQDFYTDPRAKLLFKAYACTVLNRVNSITGRRYRDDPTIMSWEVMSSPVCPGCKGEATADAVVSWVDEMTQFVKCLAPKQLVSVAQQGFYGPSPPERITTNPSLSTYCQGTDFVRLSSLPAVDYATIQVHESLKQYNEVGPLNCGWKCHMNFFTEWLDTHLNDTAALVGKPLIVEGVGKRYHEDKRNELFDLVWGTLSQSILTDPESPAAGFLFNAANIGGQVDWIGSSIYLDESLPVPGPERETGLPPLEAEWMLAVGILQDSFNRRTPSEDCAAEASAKLSSVYNTTSFKLFGSNSTVQLIRDLADDAAAAS